MRGSAGPRSRSSTGAPPRQSPVDARSESVGVDVARGDPAHPTNEGLACGRGLRESTDPGGEWLTRPLVRRDDELVPTTWDVALGEMVEALAVGGGIGEDPSFIEWVRQRVPADEVPGMLANLLEAYAALREDSGARNEHRNGDGGAVGGQTFREWVDATGHETIVELAEPEEVEGYEDPCLADGKQFWYPFVEESAQPTAGEVASDD